MIRCIPNGRRGRPTARGRSCGTAGEPLAPEITREFRRITGLVSQLYVLDCLKREYNKRNRDRTVRLKEEIGKVILSKKV